MKANSLTARAAIGGIIIIGILCTIVSINVYQNTMINQYSHQSFTQDVPTSQASLNLKYYLATALAALRGWSVEKEEAYRREFVNSWQQIDFLKSQLIAFNSKKNNSLNLDELSSNLTQLKVEQEKVLEIAQTENNYPGIQLLENSAIPKANHMLTLITKLIEETSAQQGPTTLTLLKDLADFRGSLAASLASIRAYLLTQNAEFYIQYQTEWHNNQVSFTRLLASKPNFSKQNKLLFEDLASYREEFTPLPSKLFELRDSENWNIAKSWIKNKVIPLNQGVRTLINDIHQLNNANMHSSMANIEQSQDSSIRFSLIALAIGTALCIAIISILTRLTTRPIKQVADITHSISQGNLNVATKIDGSYEVQQLSKTLTQMVGTLNKVARHAIQVASGNFDSEFKPANEEDQLGNAVYNMTNNLRLITEQDNWSKTGIANLSLSIQGINDLNILLRTIMDFIGNYLSIQVGALYLFKEKKLHLTTSYAFKLRNTCDQEFSLGEGLVGQAALEQKSIIFKNIPSEQNNLEINSGVTANQANSIMVCPLINQINESTPLQGVLVLGTSEQFTEWQIKTVEQMAEVAASAIDVTMARMKLQELLEESQTQAEELQSQQEELRVANEELEQQTQMLKESQVKQQKQSNQLEQNNLDLLEQSAQLGEKNREIEERICEADLASRYKSEFLANMSHELRTPLNSLLILSESLLENTEQNLTEEQIEDLKIIHSGGHKLLTLINDILDLAKVESGKLSIIAEAFNLKSLIGSLHTQFVPISEQKHLKLDFSIDKSLPQSLISDEQRLEQVLRNLLSNALKFTEQGSVQLQVSPTQDPELLKQFSMYNNAADIEQAIIFNIQDTGIGIEPDAQEQIFTAFQQADGSTSRRYGGTGLGLAISKELAKLLGGFISFTSTPNQGSTFSLNLPLITDSKTTAKENTETIETTLEQAFVDDDRASLNDSKQNIVLIVDDDEDFVNSVIKIAHERGYQCLTASQGKSALALVNKYSVSAVILDLGLPDMHGMKVLEGLKASPDTRDIPVHIISASDSDAGAIKLGASSFLTKPVNIQNLQQVFDQFNQSHSHKLKRVLLIEDDQDSCHDLKQQLNQQNINTESTEDGNQAFELLKKKQFDCIILDLSIKDMNSLQWFEKTEQNKIALPPVIVYTEEQIDEEKYRQLLRFTNHIVVKGQQSSERLYEEIVLFLTSSKTSEGNGTETHTAIVSDKKIDGKKVMLVDDDLRNTYALSKVLKANGLEIIIADNGQMAIDKLEQERDIDLILMDIMMPVMDGYQAIKEIRKKYQQDYPIIALTAKAMTDDRAHCMNAGANDYLTKPVASEHLMEMVRLWLHQ